MTAPVDLGPCGYCSHPQWSHKRGKGGCGHVDCGGVCGQYEPPPTGPTEADDVVVPVVADPAAYVEQVADLAAELTEERAGHQITAAILGRVRADLADERGKHEQTELARQKFAQLLDEVAAKLADERAAHHRTAGQAEDAERRAEALAGELAAERAAADRLRADLARATTRAQRTKTQLDEAVTAGVTAATRVMWRYDASQCLTEGCGARYTVPVDHEHPLFPVTVLVAHRPADA
ncbi:hypothetical protein ACH4T9_19860 [Micromonospora sp. NPDC020750]|uniref:hypothetical protein n=1 Tax=unclassified Micromonospora TaxID=2617518 RepID=UPI0037BD35D3